MAGEEPGNPVFRHTPVMVQEVLRFLQCRPGQTILDCTLGEGGHARQILPQILPGGLLLGIDRDREVLAAARKNLEEFKANLVIRAGNFSDLRELVGESKLADFDGVLFDLGISTWHLDHPERGFSFQTEAPLDMRMDRSEETTASDLVNNLSEGELSEIIYRFGEERRARRISRCLVEVRKRHPITTTQDLSAAVMRAVGRRGRIHPATRTFQALRIYLNRELEALEKALPEAIELLKPGGRICVISFHSLEDRIVKREFKRGVLENGFLKLITSKPLRPSQAEVQSNRRSRSAKLRVAEKAGT